MTPGTEFWYKGSCGLENSILNIWIYEVFTASVVQILPHLQDWSVTHQPSGMLVSAYKSARWHRPEVKRCRKDGRRGWSRWRLSIFKLKGCGVGVLKGKLRVWVSKRMEGVWCNETKNWGINLRCKNWQNFLEVIYKIIS
jgi:hypothetical protein